MNPPDHHPSPTALDAYATGDGHLHRRVIIDAHLSFCARCRKAVESTARVGGAWLHRLPPDPPPSDDLWARIDAAIDAEPLRLAADDSRITDDFLPFPRPARAALEPAFDLAPSPPEELPWVPIGKSPTRAVLIHRDPQSDRSLYLLRVPAGTAVPEHEHLGAEYLTVVAGAYRDASGRFSVGDYTVYPTGSDHHPLAESGETCWAVLSLANGIRFAS